MITAPSWRLKMGLRNGIIYQTAAKDRSKCAVLMRCKGQDENILGKLTWEKRE